MKLIESNQDKYKISIEGNWNLEYLDKFSRAYEQIYFLIFSLYSHDNNIQQKRINDAFQNYPWKGGYSTVNFYENLKLPNHRLKILSIQYKSQGWICLLLYVEVANSMSESIKNIAINIKDMKKTYDGIYKDMQKRKLLGIKQKEKALKLKENINFIEKSGNEIEKIIKINVITMDKLNMKTNDPLISLKILMSLFRRIHKLAIYQNDKKIDFNKKQ